MTETILALFFAFNPLDPEPYIATFGLVGIFVILFAETGLLLGFFLPGDSLLFLAGVLAAAAAAPGGVELPLAALLIGCPVAAVLGAQLGYVLGASAGRRVFTGARRKRMDRAEGYFVRFGPAKAVLLARFIGIIRTFINPAAAILGMPARRFLVFNIIGAIVWTDGLLLVGYLLGSVFPQLRDHLELLILGIVVLATVPGIIGMSRARPVAEKG